MSSSKGKSTKKFSAKKQSNKGREHNPEYVPMLRYGPDTNHLQWCKKIEGVGNLKYGSFASDVCRYGNFGLPDEVDEGDYDLESAAQLVQYKNEIKEYNRELKAVKEKKSKLYFFMWENMSNESQDAVKRRPDFVEFHTRDPLRLWNAIKESHGVNDAYLNEAMVKMDLRNRLRNCRQGDNESISEFYERFTHRVECVNEAEEEDMPEGNVAMDFFYNLSSRCQEFKSQFTNDVNQGKIAVPATLADMYSMANKFVPTVRTIKPSTSSVFKTQIDDQDDQGSVTQKSKKMDKQQKVNCGKDAKKDDGGDRESESKNIDDVQCFNCKGYGHYKSQCPSKPRVNVKRTTIEKREKAELGQVLLDNQADKSIFRPELLCDMKPANAVVKGITENTIKVNLKGLLLDFFECLASPEIGVNILSFAEVEKKFKISYVRNKAFVIHLPNRNLWFRKRNNLYVGDMSEWIDRARESRSVHAALTNSTLLTGNRFNPREVRMARKAYQFMHDAGIVSEVDAVNIINDGNIVGVDFTAQDVRNAMKLFGPQPSYVRGKMTKKKISKMPIDQCLKDDPRTNQNLCSDVMYVGGAPFLVSLADPLGLLISTVLKSVDIKSLVAAFHGQSNLLASRGFAVMKVFIDPQPGHRSIDGSIPGIEFDVGGSGDHSDRVDQKIRRVKECVRSVHSGLPWPMPRMFLSDIVSYAVARLNNLRPHRVQGSNVSPRVAFTGRKPDFKKEFSIAFGDYCECYANRGKSNDALQDRSEPCIALYPVNNSSGSWVMFNLISKRRIRRSNWKKMVTNDLIIDAVKSLVTDEQNGFVRSEEIDSDESYVVPVLEPAPRRQEVAVVDQGQNTGVPVVRDDDELVTEQDDSDIIPEVINESDSDDGEPAVDDQSEEMDYESEPDDEDEDLKTVDEDESNVNYGSEAEQICTVSHISVKKGIDQFGQPARDAVIAELEQLFKTKAALKPVHRSDLSECDRKNVIRSFMFLKAKYDAMGVFEKIKARLVANGAQQTAYSKVETASPTVAIESVMTVLSIAAKEKRRIATVDIGGAYLNAEMTGEPVFIELDAELAVILTAKFPDVKQYVDSQGKIVARLDKALYGCVQSALLWYKTMTNYLSEIGFVMNEVDPCVWNTVINGKQVTLCLFVDDGLITCEDENSILWVIGKLEEKFREVKKNLDNDLSFIGMHIKWDNSQNGEIVVNSINFIDKVLESNEVSGVAVSPAGNSLFKVDESTALTQSETKKFHSEVAKLLYLANHGRPDIMLAISYLATRVKAPTQSDHNKLVRVLKYLKGSREKTMVFKGSGEKIECYVDAAFAIHSDGKSHTGVVLKVFGDTVLVKSSKQKIITTNSTESELVGISDKVLLAIKCYEFLKSQGLDVPTPEVLQDNTSTISLITEGGGKYRNKYMRVRQQVVLEMVRNEDIFVRYVPTQDMLADVCTKPLQGGLFREMVSRMFAKTGV